LNKNLSSFDAKKDPEQVSGTATSASSKPLIKELSKPWMQASGQRRSGSKAAASGTASKAFAHREGDLRRDGQGLSRGNSQNRLAAQKGSSCTTALTTGAGAGTPAGQHKATAAVLPSSTNARSRSLAATTTLSKKPQLAALAKNSQTIFNAKDAKQNENEPMKAKHNI